LLIIKVLTLRFTKYYDKVGTRMTRMVLPTRILTDFFTAKLIKVYASLFLGFYFSQRRRDAKGGTRGMISKQKKLQDGGF